MALSLTLTPQELQTLDAAFPDQNNQTSGQGPSAFFRRLDHGNSWFVNSVRRCTISARYHNTIAPYRSRQRAIQKRELTATQNVLGRYKACAQQLPRG